MSKQEKLAALRKWMRKWTYALIAAGLGVVGSVFLVVSILRYRAVMFAEQYSPDPQYWGYFGDFVGGFAGTLIAWLTLIALAITIWIQGTELTETRDQLTRAADAATEQLRVTHIYEARRLQPMIKVEWHHLGDNIAGCRFVNVGLGPAVLDEIEFRRPEAEESRAHSVSDTPTAKEQWRAAISEALGGDAAGDFEIYVTDYNESMRVVAVAEPQVGVAIHFGTTSRIKRFVEVLNSKLRPVVVFHSLSGDHWSTLTQVHPIEQLHKWTAELV